MLSAWIVDKEPQQGLVLMMRNPYYWKVDTSGQQLPYVEDLRIDFVANHDIATQKTIQGELDYVGPHDVSIARFPLYKENEPNQHYQVMDYVSCMTDRYTLYPNHTLTEDPVLQDIVRHPNFVKAVERRYRPPRRSIRISSSVLPRWGSWRRCPTPSTSSRPMPKPTPSLTPIWPTNCWMRWG